jgi:hypothetical protein
MAHQERYAVSGLQRELDLYRGEEYETPPASAVACSLTGSPKTCSINVINTVGARVTVTFVIDDSQKTGKIITSPHSYMKNNVTYNVPQVTQDIVGLKKPGNTIITGTAPKLLEYDEGTGKLVNKKRPVIGGELSDVPMKFEIDVAGKLLKASAYVGKWWTNEYQVQDPKDDQIQKLNTFIAGLPLPQQEVGDDFDDEYISHEREARDDFPDEEAGDEFEYEEDDEPEDEFELELELNDLEDDGITENFAGRLHELSTQSFESEHELDEELDRALDAVENEFYVNRLRRKRKRGKKKGLFKKILSTGAKIVGKVVGKTPIGSLIKAGTSLVRGNIKGALGNLAKAAVGTALGPVAGTVATTAIDALSGGGEEGGGEGEIRRGGRRRRAMRRVARIARDAYRELADTLPENFDHPLVANEVARTAVRKAMIKNGVRPPARTGGAPPDRPARPMGRIGGSPPEKGVRRVIRLDPGERVVVIGR